MKYQLLFWLAEAVNVLLICVIFMLLSLVRKQRVLMQDVLSALHELFMRVQSERDRGDEWKDD